MSARKRSVGTGTKASKATKAPRKAPAKAPTKRRASTAAASATDGDQTLATPRRGPTQSGRVIATRVTNFTKLGLDKLFRSSDFVAGLTRVQLPPLGVPMRRPDDHFVGTLFRDNLSITRGSDPRLVRANASKPARLILELPPQSFGEEAYLDATGPEAPTNAPPGEAFLEKRNATRNAAEPLRALPSVKMRMAGPSRLAFTMPAGVASVPYSFAGILAACRTWPMARALAAQPPAPPLGLLFKHDVGFVLGMIGSQEFVSSRTMLSDALNTLGGPDLDRLAQNASARLARQATELVANGLREGTDVQMTALFRAEVDGVSARMPVARDAQVRAVVVAAISLHTTSALAELARARPELDIGDVFPMMRMIIQPQPVPWNLTKLEIPYRLIISPVGTARFEHDTVARLKGGRHELWHTHVTASDLRTGPDRATAFRAIWSDDYALTEARRQEVSDDLKPFRMPMDPMDRGMLVSLMAGFHLEAASIRPRPYQPIPSTAQRLHLSSLGALLDSEGNWATRPVGVDIMQWRHLATLGRDHYVRVMYVGFLWPFGHAATLVKVTERKFESATHVPGATATANRVAVLRQRFFIVVREAVKEYAGARHVTGGHVFPFTKIEILTRVTPNLTAPTDNRVRLIEVTGKPVIGDGIAKRMVFWPMTGGGDFPFEIAATDRDGQQSTFSLPLLFVSEVPNQRAPKVDHINAAYATAPAAKRTAELRGASVAFAPVDRSALGDTRLPTQRLMFTAGAVSFSSTLCNVYPEIDTAVVGIKAVERLLGRSNAETTVRYEAKYRTDGFSGGNKGEVFLRLVTPYDLKFGGDAASSKNDSLGALASPSLAIAGLSRLMGPAADIDNIIAGPGNSAPRFDPAKFFENAKLLGSIPLESLLSVVTGITGADVPKLVSRTIDAGGGLPERVEARFSWVTALKKPDLLNMFVPTSGGTKQTMLAMNGVMSAPVSDPTGATFEADAKINDFKLNLFGFIILSFVSLRFDVKRGQKPDVAVDLDPVNGVRFGGPLEFVNKLKDIIPANGFSDPPSLSVTPSGISASYSLNVPNLQVGIFALSNLSVGAGFSLPFDTQPVQVTFNFCTREKPFSLTVSLLGGGGFFAIGIGADGVREIEAAIEFGAALSINLGVASGSVEIKAGVYFHWITSSDGEGLVELTGYIRLYGELSVLGLISVSLTFNLQLSYLKEGSRSTVWGEATLTVTIDVLCFSADVSVHCRREFGGSPSDPTFLDLVPDASNWQAYCLAYGED